jgi:hypothetical protein
MQVPSKTRALRLAAPAVVGLVFLAACDSSNSGVRKNATKASSGEPSRGASLIDMGCLGDKIANPTEAFHYSFKSAGSRAVEKEADITPQAMVVTLKGPSGPHTYRGTRSDEASWNSGVLDISSLDLTRLIARISFLKDNSSTRLVGPEQVNGYQATKYAIDTTSANAADKQTFGTLFGAASLDQGAIWVTQQGCPVKLILDETVQAGSGTVEKTHYEIEVVRS